MGIIPTILDSGSCQRAIQCSATHKHGSIHINIHGYRDWPYIAWSFRS